MFKRPPEFWRTDAGPWPLILQPLSLLWSAGGALKAALTTPYTASVPVICVGNLGVGGAGKTPVALAVANRLRHHKIAAHFLIRGYGGRLKGPLRVDAKHHSADDVGDEALLLAAVAPTWIGADRGASARAAVAAGAGALVMDDGHQNRSLVKDLSLIVVDGDYGFGNGRVMPAGPLREPVAPGLARADAMIVLNGADGGAIPSGGLPVLYADLAPAPGAERKAGSKVVAFAGIGRPEKFFTTLEGLGCEIVARHAFADHHRFSADEIMRIVEAAAAAGARPITTAKDAVRLPDEARAMIDVLEVGVEFADGQAIEDLLRPIVQAGGGD